MSYDGPTPPPMFPRSVARPMKKLTAEELCRIIAAGNPFNRIEDRETELKRNLQRR
jgi:hypothetical protein